MLAQLPQSVLSSLDYLQPQPEEHMFILVVLQDRVIFFMSFEWCALGKSKLFSCSPFGKGRKGRKRLRYLISLPSPPSSPSSIACKCYTDNKIDHIPYIISLSFVELSDLRLCRPLL